MSTMTVEELVAKRTSLEKDLRSWQQKAAVAQAEEDRIKKEIAEDLTRLKEEFNCSTLDQAKELRDTLLTELESLCGELETKLNDLRNS